MCCRVGLTIFVVLEFIALAAATIATPFDMFRRHDEEQFKNTPCLTLWGSKTKCYSTHYEVSTADYWKGCDSRRDRFRAAEVCAVVTVALMAISFVIALFQCCCCVCCKFLNVLLNLLATGTGAVVFGMMIDSWYNRRGPALIVNCMALKTSGEYKFGAGLALFIAATGLNFINIIFILLPC